MIIVEDVLQGAETGGKQCDYLEIEWYEVSKTIIRRKTTGGVDVAIRKSTARPLEDGDILWQDNGCCIQVVIKPCECIVIRPETMRDMGIICFEIGNQHIPIHIDSDYTISLAYESPVFDLLEKAGFKPRIEEKKLLKTYTLRMYGHNRSR